MSLQFYNRGLIGYNANKYLTQVGQLHAVARDEWGDLTVTLIQTTTCLVYTEQLRQVEEELLEEPKTAHRALVPLTLNVRKGDHLAFVLDLDNRFVINNARINGVMEYNHWCYGSRFKVITLDQDSDPPTTIITSTTSGTTTTTITTNIPGFTELREVVLYFGQTVPSGTAINVNFGTFGGQTSSTTVSGDPDVTFPSTGALFMDDARIEVHINGLEQTKGDGSGNGSAEWVSTTQIKLSTDIKTIDILMIRAPFPTS